MLVKIDDTPYVSSCQVGAAYAPLLLRKAMDCCFFVHRSLLPEVAATAAAVGPMLLNAILRRTSPHQVSDRHTGTHRQNPEISTHPLLPRLDLGVPFNTASQCTRMNIDSDISVQICHKLSNLPARLEDPPFVFGVRDVIIIQLDLEIF